MNPLQLNFLSKTSDKTSHILKYILIPSISLLIIALISVNPSLWITSSIHHFYVELFGAILAGILAFYYISRAQTLNDKFSLFIGIGFLVNALIDLLHATVSLLNMNDIVFLKYFIPQTWFAGRLFLSAMLAIAIVKYSSYLSVNSNIQQKQQQQISLGKKNENILSLSVLLYLIIVTLFVSIVAIISLFVVFPFSVIDDIPIHRLYETFPLGLFLLSLCYFYKNKIYKNKDIFYTSLVVSIVFDIFGQIIMSYSAHQFDTAHNIAHGLTDIIYSKIKDEDQRELLEIIMRNATRLKRLTDNLLDVTKIEGKSLMLKKEKLNLNILISEVLKEYGKKVVKQQMVKIVYDFKYIDDIIVEADRDRLDQVIRNLVDNALKFNTMYNNQIIFVIVDLKKEEEGKEQAIVSIKDTGNGISKEVLPKLFSKFTTSDSSSGTGLGLYICKNIVQAHGGKIWAENDSDGNGALFRFALPLISYLN